MCCHLNGFAPLGRCINSVVSIPEVTKGWQGSLYLPVDTQFGCHYTNLRWSGDLQVRTFKMRHSLRAKLHKDANKKTKTKKGGATAKKAAGWGAEPPPTPTLLNPIPFHRLGKNQFKSRAQRGDAKMLQYILKLQMEWGFDELHEFTLV